MIRPHGGRLVERITNELIPGSHPRIEIDWETYQDLENIATGVLSPLEGFMSKGDYERVTETGHLLSGEAWTIPILLHIREEEKKVLSEDNIARLCFQQDEVGEIEIEDIFQIEPSFYARQIFGTEDKNHPGVDRIFSSYPIVVGGRVRLSKKIEHSFSNYHLSPKETRFLFKEKGWKKVVAFQTRNVPHLGHEYVQKTALSVVDGLFINPLMGKKKKGDFKDEVIIETYLKLIKDYYPSDRVVMSILSTQMRYAGPKEAILHAIMRKNFGASHFIVGRDHAGVGNFYHPFAAHKIFEEYPDLEIEPVFFASFFRCKKCSGIANDKTCPHSGEDIVNFKGTDVRNSIVSGERPSADIMRPEVADIILGHKEPFVK